MKWFIIIPERGELVSSNTDKIINELNQSDSILHQEQFIGLYQEVDALQIARSKLMKALSRIHTDYTERWEYQILLQYSAADFDEMRRHRDTELLDICRNIFLVILWGLQNRFHGR